MSTTQNTPGTGAFEGLIWNGHQWVGNAQDPVTGALVATSDSNILRGIGFAVLAVLFAVGIEASLAIFGRTEGALPALVCAFVAAVLGILAFVKIISR